MRIFELLEKLERIVDLVYPKVEVVDVVVAG
jgi:hypothetical protein